MGGQGKEREGRRQGADSDATQPIAGQSHGEEHLEKPERAPSFLSARELQARDPGKSEARDGAEERTEKPRSKKG